MVLRKSTPETPPPAPFFTVHNLLDHWLHFWRVTEEAIFFSSFFFSYLCDSSRSSAQFRSDMFLPGFFFIPCFSPWRHTWLRCVSSCDPRGASMFNGSLAAPQVLCMFNATRAGLCFSGYCLMFYSGVRQVKVSTGHHLCNSPGWNIRVTNRWLLMVDQRQESVLIAWQFLLHIRVCVRER